MEDAIAEFREAVEGLPYRITFERGALQLPTKHTSDSAIVASVEEAYRAVMRERPHHAYADYTIDAGYLNNVVGIPTIMFGGMDMRFAHGDNDLMKVADVQDLAKTLAFWAARNAA